MTAGVVDCVGRANMRSITKSRPGKDMERPQLKLGVADRGIECMTELVVDDIDGAGVV